MKTQILAVTLGLVMVMGIVPLPQAHAAAFIVDDFTSDPDGACDLLVVAAPSGPIPQAAAVIGGERECTLNPDVPNSPTPAGIDVVAASGMLRHAAGTGVETIMTLLYDGVGQGGGAAGLSQNLATSDNLKLVYSTSDFQVDVVATLTDGSGVSSSLTGALAAGTSSNPTVILWAIQDFKNNMPTLNLSDIDAIELEFDTVMAVTDYDLDKIEVTMRVGGEMLPISTTSLLLAGVELNAMWILPMIAAVGIGAFIVSRKRD